MIYPSDQLKKCTKCGLLKETTAFYKNKSKKDGLGSYCKQCQQSYRKEYQKSDKYKKYCESDKYKETLGKYRKSDKYKETLGKYRKSDKYKEYRKEYDKEYYKEHRKTDKRKEYLREFYKSDKGVLSNFKNNNSINTKEELILFLPKIIKQLFDDGNITSDQAIYFINTINQDETINKIFKIKAEVLNGKREAKQRTISKN